MGGLFEVGDCSWRLEYPFDLNFVARFCEACSLQVYVVLEWHGLIIFLIGDMDIYLYIKNRSEPNLLWLRRRSAWRLFNMRRPTLGIWNIILIVDLLARGGDWFVVPLFSDVFELPDPKGYVDICLWWFMILCTSEYQVSSEKC